MKTKKITTKVKIYPNNNGTVLLQIALTSKQMKDYLFQYGSQPRSMWNIELVVRGC